VLILATPILVKLDKDMAELAASTLTTPPLDYAAFMRIVGKYQSMLELRNFVLELSKKGDE
jgi:hypothetical protein